MRYKRGMHPNSIKHRFKNGHTPWLKGTKGLVKVNSGSFKKGTIPWVKGRKRPQISKMRKEEWNNLEKRNKRIKNMKKNARKRALKRWRNKEYKEKQIKLMLKGLFKRPTSLEKQMIDVIQRHNLPYKYVGDGSFWIGFKNPDFININGKKVCIEVGNTYHHQGDWSKQRIKHFAKYGWKCVVFITDKIDEHDILKNIGGD